MDLEDDSENNLDLKKDLGITAKFESNKISLF